MVKKDAIVIVENTAKATLITITAEGYMKVGKCKSCGRPIIVELTQRPFQVCRECGGIARNYGRHPLFMRETYLKGKIGKFGSVRDVLRPTHNPDKVYGI